MNRILQRAVALLLIPLTAFSIIINSYGTAYAAAVLPVTYGMGEVWWTLCASMGISFELTGTDAVQEFAKEMKDTFDLWVTDNGFNEIDANAIKEEIAGLPSKVKDGAMTLSQKAWDALKSFRLELLKDDNDINISSNVYDLDSFSSSIADINLSSSAISKLYSILCRYKSVYIDYCNYTNSYYFGFSNRIIEKVDLNISNMSGYVYYTDGAKFCIGYGNTNYEYSISDESVNSVHGSHNCTRCLCVGYMNLISNILTKLHDSLAYDLCPVTQPYLDGYDVVTKGRTWSDTNGLTGDLILNIPTDLVGQDVITGGLTWEDIMDRIGVIPVDTVGDVVIPWDDTLDVPETIPDAIDRVNDTTIDKPGTEDKDDEKTDEDEDLDIKIPSAVGDLKKQFPFCIPFDLIDCVKMFSADAKAPKWEFDIYIKPIKYHWILTIDMSDYETLVKLFKTGQVILFIVGLAILTPTVTKWNGGGE